jgi:hypothetical protein
MSHDTQDRVLYALISDYAGKGEKPRPSMKRPSDLLLNNSKYFKQNLVGNRRIGLRTAVASCECRHGKQTPVHVLKNCPLITRRKDLSLAGASHPRWPCRTQKKKKEKEEEVGISGLFADLNPWEIMT